MASIQPHINFNGNAEEAFHFYQSVFGGEFSKIVRFKDLAGPGFEIDKEEENKLMNIALSIGDNVLIGNDVPQFMGRVSEEENRSKIAIFAESRAEADHIFSGLSAGGSVEVPMTDSPWGSYFGMLRDKYGIEWTITFENKI
ncbi:MAG TPA: VOC family protein [Saprospiraceae bacterium]|jgi:PhnB protein|nr:VOC family protein [Saprospiraceae bacterium]HMT70473.1 VOC family protein [Saprospiraceae bacterium]